MIFILFDLQPGTSLGTLNSPPIKSMNAALYALGGVTTAFGLFRYFYMNGKSANLNVDLTGKVIMITGSSDGIGLTTTKILAKMGATIYLACRDENKTKKVIQDTITETGNKNLFFLHLDLADLDSVATCCTQFKKLNIPLDILINNAGAISISLDKKFETKQGYELMFGVNYLGHFLLNRLMSDDLIKSKGRLVIVASDAQFFVKSSVQDFEFLSKTKYPFQETGYAAVLSQYGFTKLLNVMHSKKMHQELNSKGVQVNCLHPGAIFSSISRDAGPILKFFADPVMYLFMKTAYQGSQCTVHVATKKDNVSGEFYSDLAVAKVSHLAEDDKLCQDLWDWSNDACAKYLGK